MPNLTTNYSFNKPLVGDAIDEDLWGGYLNDNFDSLDTIIKSVSDVASSSTVSKTANYTVLTTDRNKFLLVDASAGAVTLTLPAAATSADGFAIFVKKIDSSANTVTIDGNASETIDGASTKVLYAQYDTVGIVTNATAWFARNLTEKRLDTVSASKTTAYTATVNDDFIRCDATSAAFAVTLYTAVGNAGRKLTIKKTDITTNAVTVDANSTETIDGDLTFVLPAQYSEVVIISDGSNWNVLSKIKHRAKSTALTPTAGGSGSFTHGLGAEPDLWYGILKCTSTTGSGGAAVGDEITVCYHGYSTAGIQIYKNGSTDINWRIPSGGLIYNNVVLTLSSFELYLVAVVF